MKNDVFFFGQVPAPPNVDSEGGFVVVNAPDVSSSGAESGDRASVYKRLQEELVNQIKVAVLHLFLSLIHTNLSIRLR